MENPVDPRETEVRRYLLHDFPVDEETFITENALAERFAMNRSAARKILLALEGEGAMYCTPRGYRRVDYRDTPPEIVAQLRFGVERAAAALAPQYADRRDIGEMIVLVEEMDDALDRADLDTYNRLDVEFHRALVSASHNPLLIKMASFLVWTAGVADPATSLAREREAIRGHHAILSALRARDRARLETEIERHFSSRITATKQ